MKIQLETSSEQAANELANEILDDVSGKKMDTWHHCIRNINNAECSCIYHYSDDDPNEDGKRIKFRVYTSGTHVSMKQTWREGYVPGRQTKLHLTRDLINMIYMRYPEKFSAINIKW